METAKDLVKRNIIPFLPPGAGIWKHFFAASNDSNYQEISQRLIIAKDHDEFGDMASKVISTGMYAQIDTFPYVLNPSEEAYKEWCRSTEIISGTFPYNTHLSNKKWPLKKVL